MGLESKNDEEAAQQRMPHRCLESSATTEGMLYERKDQEQQLLEAYQRRIDPNVNAQQQRGELVLIIGPSGTGKTALGRNLEQHVVRRRSSTTANNGDDEKGSGFFLAGKFDQLQQPEPFGPFVAAFTKFAKLVQARGDHAVQRIRNQIQESGSVEGLAILLAMVPELGKVLEISNDDDDTNESQAVSRQRRLKQQMMKGAKAQKRFFLVVRQFLRAACSPEYPIVFFFDDLQWADSVSLDFIQALVAETATTQGLMLLGACRSNEVSHQDPLSVTLRRLQDIDGIRMTKIEVSSLSQQGVGLMVGDLLQLSTEECKSLVEVVVSQTDGNVFFVVQFVRMLQEENILYMKSGTWTWDEDQLHRTASTGDDVVQLLGNTMKQLPDEVQEVLKLASCLGVEFDEATIRHVGSVVSSQVVPALETAEERGLVTFEYDTGIGRWVHDRIQQAAYSLIPETERSAFHLFLGRQLRRKLKDVAGEREYNKSLFLVVNHMGRGMDLIEEQTEKDDLSLLCLRAGEKAVLSAAFSAAARYLEQGISLLGHRHWRDQYRLSLNLFNTAAEVAYCNGSFELVDGFLKEVFSNARSLDDELWAHSTRIYALGARNELDRAIELGLQILRKLGVRLPRRPCLLHTLLEFVKTERLLSGRSDDDIMNLPPMVDKNKLAAMQIMNLISIYTLWSRQDLLPLVSMRMLQIMLRNGLHRMGGGVVGSYASILSFVGRIDDAYRYAQLALRIHDKFQANEWLARTNVSVYSSVIPWIEPLRNSLEPLLAAYHAGISSGDNEFSMLGASTYCQFCIYSGHLALDRFVEQATSFQKLFESLGQDTINAYQVATVQYGLNLLGRASGDPVVLTGEAMYEHIHLKNLVEQKNHGCVLWILGLKFLLAAYLQDYEVARTVSARMRRLKQVVLPPLKVHFFHEAVIFAALARQSRNRRDARFARRRLKLLKGYAVHSADNFTNKVELVEAELAVTDGKYDEALVWYRRSIDHAERQGFLHEQALACERAGYALLRDCGRPQEGLHFLRQARGLYERWGARVKLDRLDEVVAKAGTV